MIFGDNLEQLELIYPEAWKFIESADLEAIEDGRYDLQDGSYINVCSYTTKTADQATFEAHRQFADIQIIFEGEEVMWVNDVEDLSLTKPYDEADDYELLNYEPGDAEAREMTAVVPLYPGSFCVVMPTDAHAPGIAVEQPAPVRKIIVKMAL